jgi:hypothetical protein
MLVFTEWLQRCQQSCTGLGRSIVTQDAKPTA